MGKTLVCYLVYSGDCCYPASEQFINLWKMLVCVLVVIL